MKWIGLRDRKGGVLAPAGLRQPAADTVPAEEIMARGSLLIDCNVVPSLTEQTLLNDGAETPWPTGMRLVLDPRGMLTLTQTRGDERRSFAVQTGLQGRAAMVTVVFTWDAPNRRALLSVEVPDTGALTFTTDHGPLPLSMGDVARMMTDRTRCHLSPSVTFAAVAEGLIPIGPLPSLNGDTPIPTPRGPVALNRIRPGQIVQTADGGTAQVRWVGGLALPARARFTPLRLRAPFYGARHDILCAPCQQIHFRSTDVEYLFAAHTVAARAGDLLDGIGPQADHTAPTVAYWQMLLDRAVPISIHGVACETLDASPLIADAGLRAHSMLRHMPPELLPLGRTRTVPRLQAFETRSLCELRVA